MTVQTLEELSRAAPQMKRITLEESSSQLTFADIAQLRGGARRQSVHFDQIQSLGKVESLNTEDEVKALFAMLNKQKKTEWIDEAFKNIRAEFIPVVLEHAAEDKKREYMLRYRDWINRVYSSLISIQDAGVTMRCASSPTDPIHPLAPCLALLVPYLAGNLSVQMQGAMASTESQKDVQTILQTIAPKTGSLTIVDNPQVTKATVQLLQNAPAAAVVRFKGCTLKDDACVAFCELPPGSSLLIDERCILSTKGYQQLYNQAGITLQVPVPSTALAELRPEQCLPIMLTQSPQKALEMAQVLAERLAAKPAEFSSPQLEELLRYAHSNSCESLFQHCVGEVLNTRLAGLLKIDLDTKTTAHYVNR